MITSEAPPCPKCGCTTAALVVDTSNPDVDELPIYRACVRCNTRTPETKRDAVEAPVTE